MLSYVLSFYNDLFMYLDTTVHSMTLEQRYHFLLPVRRDDKGQGSLHRPRVLREGVEYHERRLINGRFLIHAMDYWVLSFLYIVECEGDT